MKRLAIVTTHPIQYYAPVFKLLAESLAIKVFYTWGKDSMEAKFDPGFGKNVQWDIPLLEGYPYEFLENIAKDPGSHHFKGINNQHIIQKIQHFSADAILVFGWSNSSHLKVLRYFKGKIPVWFRGDSNLIDQQAGWKQILRTLFLKWLYSHVDKAFYVGKANKKYFIKNGLKEEELSFAPHAVDNARFSIDRREEALTLRKSLGIAENEIIILFAGKLEPKKNPELLLKAFSQINEHAHLLFVGNGMLESKLKAERLSLKAPDRVHFIDFQNQKMMPVIYQACDLFCLPSKGPGETWGLAVNEAMAAAKAVLVSDKVGCAENLVQNGYNGAIFRHDSITDLAQKLSSLINDRRALQQMGENSLKTIKDWSFEKQAFAFEKALLNVNFKKA